MSVPGAGLRPCWWLLTQEAPQPHGGDRLRTRAVTFFPAAWRVWQETGPLGSSASASALRPPEADPPGMLEEPLSLLNKVT